MKYNGMKEQMYSSYSENIAEQEANIKIVGIKYRDDEEDYTVSYYATKELMADLRKYINKSNSTIKILFNNQINDSNQASFNLLPSNKVAKGEVVVDNDLRYNVKNGKINGMDIEVTAINIYYQDTLKLKISNTYTKSSFKRLTGYNKYDENRYSIFINQEEYDSLFNKPSYQSSVYVKNIENIDQTMQELENTGLKPKKISDYKVNINQMEKQVIKITKLIVTCILIFVLFFISYFIIRIILKSRNIYYTTLRMLGATYKSVRRILDIELFLNSTIAYTSVLILIALAKGSIIKIEYITKLAGFIGLKEYILMYVIIALMSRLISRRFSRKLFKNTAINTYNEEV